MKIDPDDPVAPSLQLVAALLDAMASGSLGAGDKLPTVRGLAAEVGVNANTVKKSYRDLQQLGAVRGISGRGVFVTAQAVDIAKAIRLVETLTAFRSVTAQALRAGHEQSLLAQELMRMGRTSLAPAQPAATS